MELMISIFPLLNFYLYVPTFQQHLHMDYISLNCSHIPELVVITGPNVPCGQSVATQRHGCTCINIVFTKKYK